MNTNLKTSFGAILGVGLGVIVLVVLSSPSFLNSSLYQASPVHASENSSFSASASARNYSPASPLPSSYFASALSRSGFEIPIILGLLVSVSLGVSIIISRETSRRVVSEDSPKVNKDCEENQK
jgi:uncharacterized membrane protein